VSRFLKRRGPNEMRRASPRRDRRELRRFTAAERFSRLPGLWRARGAATVSFALRLWFARRTGRPSYFWVEEPMSPSSVLHFCAQTSPAERLAVMRWLATNAFPDFRRTPWFYRNTREVAWAHARYHPGTTNELYTETPREDKRCVGSTCLALARACAVRALTVDDLLGMDTHTGFEPVRRFFEKRLAALR
jgi:hypothetical protein